MMETMVIHWRKSIKSLSWCQFTADILNDPRLEANLDGDSRPHFSIRAIGVYIIWTGKHKRRILKVGSGIIKDKLKAHLGDPKILAHKSKGLYATWATTLFGNKPRRIRKGIETFLHIILAPKLAESIPDVDPILVNLPVWDEPANARSKHRNLRDPYFFTASISKDTLALSDLCQRNLLI